MWRRTWERRRTWRESAHSVGRLSEQVRAWLIRIGTQMPVSHVKGRPLVLPEHMRD